MGKILKTINLVIGAIRPKHVTWSLDKSGSGYEKIEDEIDNNFEMYLPDNVIGSVKTKKEIESKSGINIQGTKNPKFTSEELRCEIQTNLETIKSMQETIHLKSKKIKKIVNKTKNKVLEIVHCRFTPKELPREKQADVETLRRLKN